VNQVRPTVEPQRRD